MGKYESRKIQFKEVIDLNDWKVKIYTISKAGEFNHPIFYQNALNKLPEWVNQKNSFDSSNEKIAFLILHSGTEGIFSLINWWVGKNMLNTNIFITNHDRLNEFAKISGDGLAPCIWELEVINHERISWTNHVLKQEPNPDYFTYLNDVMSKEI